MHPPFAKLAFAFAGWVIGYDGHFLFDNIGDSYLKNNVPYVGLRALPAILGSLTVPIVFLIMKDSGYGLPATIIATSMVLFDNAHIAEDRLILLDAMLVFSMASAIYSYIRFYKNRHVPFSVAWWKWLLLTGLALSSVMSTKYVGLFSYVTIGSAVAIDLWDLLDIKRGLPMSKVVKHFCARLVGLVIIPFMIYLFWFWVHFTVLNRSGPGDDFMSPEFQETLSDNLMTLESTPINYFDVLTLRHKETKAYLHSHLANYPLRYDDGRVSSAGQQVTGYPFNDTNNHWQIVPVAQLAENLASNTRVRNNHVVKLRHIQTDTYLLSHDVASPYYPTNQEFTTVSEDLAHGERAADTQFQLQFVSGKSDQEFKTKAGLFKLVHVPTKVAMWTDKAPLPEWGFKQQEINGNKKIIDASNVWFPESIEGLTDADRLKVEPKKLKTLPFYKKYLELQRAMFHHNSMLTSSHPYATQPIQWPFLLRGVSFWTKDDGQHQIYLLGNPFGWWLAIAVTAILTGVLSADQITRRRGEEAISALTRKRLYNSTGFFFLCWVAHYLPFYLMGRQLFLHHYLPAHLASSLVTGAMVQFIFARIGRKSMSAILTSDLKQIKVAGPVPERDENGLLAWAVTIVIVGCLVSSFVYFAPVTYGTPGLTVQGALNRKLLETWDMHFLK